MKTGARPVGGLTARARATCTARRIRSWRVLSVSGGGGRTRTHRRWPFDGGGHRAFCFGERADILDGNVKRVLTRAFGIADDLSEAPARLWQRAEA